MLLVATLFYHKAKGLYDTLCYKERVGTQKLSLYDFYGQNSSQQNLCVNLANDIVFKRLNFLERQLNLPSFSVPPPTSPTP